MNAYNIYCCHDTNGLIIKKRNKLKQNNINVNLYLSYIFFYIHYGVLLSENDINMRRKYVNVFLAIDLPVFPNSSLNFK